MAGVWQGGWRLVAYSCPRACGPTHLAVSSLNNPIFFYWCHCQGFGICSWFDLSKKERTWCICGAVNSPGEELIGDCRVWFGFWYCNVMAPPFNLLLFQRAVGPRLNFIITSLQWSNYGAHWWWGVDRICFAYYGNYSLFGIQIWDCLYDLVPLNSVFKFEIPSITLWQF